MSTARNVARLVGELVRFGRATGRLSLAVVVIVGLALLAVTIAVQLAAPLAIYPFV